MAFSQEGDSPSAKRPKGRRRPRSPTESAFAFGLSSSTPPQEWSDSAHGSASSVAPQGGSDSVCGSASSTSSQEGDDSAYGSAFSAAPQGGGDGGLPASLTTSQGGNDVGVARYEGYYASILYTIFSTLNLDIRTEDASVRGRADIVVIYQKQVFVFELKVADGVDVEVKAEQALAQMRERDYAGKYRTDGNRIHLLAVVFDWQKRNLATIRSLPP